MIERAGCRPTGLGYCRRITQRLRAGLMNGAPAGLERVRLRSPLRGLSRVRLRGSAGWRGLIAMSAGGGAALIAASLLVLRAR